MSFKKDFSLINEDKVHYLDSAATSQKPYSVIQKVSEYYEKYNGNPGRGSHKFSIESEKIMNEGRKTVQQFINAKKTEEIIFTKSATESINLVAYCYALEKLKEGDEIVLGISNHHANIVPWQMVSKKKNIKLKYVYLDENGKIDLKSLSKLITEKTKIVSFSGVVNVTGVINPIKEIIELSHNVGAIVLLDAAQSILHFKHDVQELDVDFLVFSGHKLFAEMGIGVLYGKKDLLENMEPFIYGGDMIEFVTEQDTTFASLPNKFEGGTQNVGGVVSLKAGIDYLNSIGYEKISKIEKELTTYAMDKLKELPYVEVYFGETNDKAGILAFNVKEVHSHDVAFILDSFGVYVRSGHHCAQPFMKYIGVPSCCRASFGVYNELSDIDKLVEALKKVKDVFNL